jgi:uncharacterized protein with HEPN domain
LSLRPANLFSSIFRNSFSSLYFILDSINKIFEYSSAITDAKKFQNDYLRFDETLMNFIVIGEMVGKLSNELKSNTKNINWEKIYAFRNVFANDYFEILEKEVWEIIVKDLPLFKQEIEKII